MGEPHSGGQATSKAEAQGFASPFRNGFALSEALKTLADGHSEVNTRSSGRDFSRLLSEPAAARPAQSGECLPSSGAWRETGAMSGFFHASIR